MYYTWVNVNLNLFGMSFLRTGDSVSGLGRPLWLRVIQSASFHRNLAFPVCYRRTSSGRININRLPYKCIGTQDLSVFHEVHIFI